MEHTREVDAVLGAFDRARSIAVEHRRDGVDDCGGHRAAGSLRARLQPSVRVDIADHETEEAREEARVRETGKIFRPWYRNGNIRDRCELVE